MKRALMICTDLTNKDGKWHTTYMTWEVGYHPPSYQELSEDQNQSV